MFSALSHFPATMFHLKTQALPGSFGQDRSVTYQPPNVSGENRFKYFRRPIIPYAPTFAGQVIYARKPVQVLQPVNQRAPSPFQKTIAVQTLYR
jgi:hypothetical protein